MQTSPNHIEDVLVREGFFISTTVGVSMWPMLRDRRDTVVIRPVQGRLKRFDVPLYRRGDAYVLHRVVEVRPDSYVMLGDNCIGKERGITDDQVVGVLDSFYRGGRLVRLDARGYRAYVRAWCAFHPVWRGLKRLRLVVARAARTVGVRRVPKPKDGK